MAFVTQLTLDRAAKTVVVKLSGLTPNPDVLYTFDGTAKTVTLGAIAVQAVRTLEDAIQAVDTGIQAIRQAEQWFGSPPLPQRPESLLDKVELHKNPLELSVWLGAVAFKYEYDQLAKELTVTPNGSATVPFEVYNAYIQLIQRFVLAAQSLV